MGISDLDNISGDEIKKCVLELLDSLYNRNGFDDWWHNLDNDIKAEIEAELFSIMDRRFNKHKFEPLTPEQDKTLKALKKSAKLAGEVSDFLGNPVKLGIHEDSWKEARKDFTVYERDENGKYKKKP